MKVLHLFSNSKWTGPAEPALSLCVALRKVGVDTDFACAPYCGKSINKVVETARDLGMEPILSFYLCKHRHPMKNFIDRSRLNTFLSKGQYDIVHCHLENAHRIALGPANKLGIPVVRSNYEGAGLSKTSSRLLRKTSFIIEPSQIASKYDIETYGFPREKTQVIANAVDTVRFDPSREVPDGRCRLGIPTDAFVIGIVARMQTHRHYDVFLRVIRRLVDIDANTHVIVVGRGTNQEAVGMQPVRELDLEENVHFPGFIDGEDYVGMLKVFDVKVFMVPGSDGTCRAVREAMAMAKPAVVADRGMLREIVEDGSDGYVFDGSEEALFNILGSLNSDRNRTREMGQAARKKAVGSYSLEVQANEVCNVYKKILRH